MSQDLEAKLLAKRRIEDCGYESPCWIWTGSTSTATGYGNVWYSEAKENFLVHRIAACIWLDFDLFSDLCVLHRCDNPPCFNPRHLFFGTKKDNTQDMVRKGRGRGGTRGEQNGRSLLTDSDVRAIRKETDRYARIPWGTYPRLAAKYGVTASAIKQVADRHNWKHVA